MNKFLENLESKKLSHAYCLVGQSSQALDALAEMIKKLKIDSNETYIMGDNVAIKEARDIVTWLNKRPLNGQYKLIYLDLKDIRVDALTTLLKTVEEPPSYGLIVLRASNMGNVLGTIKSRCQVIWLGNKEVEDKLGTNQENKDSLVDFLSVPDQLESGSVEDILDNWILKELPNIRSGSNTAYIDKLLKLKEYSRGNTNNRLLLEYAILCNEVNKI